MTKKVLVVCLGNICRSPLAQAIFQVKADAAGLDMKIDSAGTGAWHLGDPPDARAIVAGRLKGYDLTQMRARQIIDADFRQFDLILTVDHSVTRDVEALRPLGAEGPVHLITQYASGDVPDEVPDPYYTGKFNFVIDLMEQCADGLLDQLRNARQ